MLFSPDVLSPSEETSLKNIRYWLHDRAGIFYEERKKELLINRLRRVCERFDYGGLQELETHLIGRQISALQSAVIHAATTNHTYFFREPQVLNHFANAIVPALPGEQLRLWNAAASTGDETYTLAIILCEKWGIPATAKRVSILGTDISAPVIAQAESGIYTFNHLEHMPQTLLEKYFHPTGMEQYRIRPEIRELCLFRRLNLKISPYPFRRLFHVVFLRNVLYYFDKPHQISTVRALYEITEPGGWLVTSVTESLRDLDSPWVPVSSGIYRKMA
ncbi:protein-glutamate O-methyltransferase CheR [Candidatus Woesearchaeota archaeon]|nr:protein-glutamate O-methyltransferase CheR [Candidatus Woesearchaeota archaeon]